MGKATDKLSNNMKVTLKIEGMTCASCVGRVETALKKVNGFGFGTRQVANNRNHGVACGVGLVVEGLELVNGDRGDALGIAITGVGIRVVTVQALEQFVAGQFAGVLFLKLEAGEQLVLDPRQGVGREGGFAHHLGEQVERRCAFIYIAQAAQRGHGHVAICAIAEVRAQAFKALGDGAHIFTRYTFVEHGVGQQGQARGVFVLAAASGEGQAQVEHRQLPCFDEQHFGAFGGFPGLHVQRTVAGRLAVQLGQGFELVLALGLVQCLAGDRLLRVGKKVAECTHQYGGAQTKQGVAGAFTLTHGFSPRAVHGQR